MMRLGILDVDFVEELDVEEVSGLLSVRGTLEGETGRLQVQLERLGWYVWDADCEVDVVLLGV
jgi:hypothetical protein